MRKPLYYIGKPVESLQTMLRVISQNDPRTLPIIPNGLYGSSTYASVRSFQISHNLTPTGETDLETWKCIIETYTKTLPYHETPTISIPWRLDQTLLHGESNDHIYLVQAMLNALSKYYPSLQPPALTGSLDTLTQKGLEWLQTASGLPVTGHLDIATWNYLSKLYATTLGDGKE